MATAVHVPTEDIFNIVCETEYALGKKWGGETVLFSRISNSYKDNGVIYIEGYQKLMHGSMEHAFLAKNAILTIADYCKLRNICIDVGIKSKDKITSKIYKAIYNSNLIYCIVPSGMEISDRKYNGCLIKDKFYVFK